MAGLKPLGTADDVAGFAFKQRHGKINWHQLESLDLNYVLQTGDVDAVHSVLENLTYALLEREDLTRLSDAKAVQLFKLFQLCLEYLLNVQNSLYSQTQQLQSQYTSVRAQTAALEGKVRSQEKELDTRTHEIASKRKALVSYEYLLRQPSTSAAAAQALTRANAVKCSACGKLFLSREYLDKHELRRHAVRKEPPPPKQDQAFGAMLDTMKTILSQNLAVVSEAHAREIEAMKSAFERKLQDLEAARLSLEARRTELEAAPQANSVNDLVLRELINTQNEMRRVLEERDHLVLEQMRQADEQRRRQEELDKERQLALEQRLTQLVQTQLLAHLPTEPVKPPTPREIVREVTPEKTAPVAPLPAPPQPPTLLQLTIERPQISSRAGDVEEDEPSPQDIVAALGFDKKEEIEEIQEIGEISNRGEGTAGGLMTSLNYRDSGPLELQDIDDELSSAALALGVDLAKEPELLFVVRAYISNCRKGRKSERLTNVYKRTVETLRKQRSPSMWKAFLLDQENERPVGENFSKFTAFFNHKALDLKRAKDNLRLPSQPEFKEISPAALPVLSRIRDSVRRLLPETVLRAVSPAQPPASPQPPAPQPDVSQPTIPVVSLPPKPTAPQPIPHEEEKVPAESPQPAKPHRAAFLGRHLVSSALKETQGFTEKLDFATMLDPVDRASLGYTANEGTVVAYGRIGHNGIEEVTEESRKSRNRTIVHKVLRGLTHSSPAD